MSYRERMRECRKRLEGKEEGESGVVSGRCESQQVTEVPFKFRTNHKH